MKLKLLAYNTSPYPPPLLPPDVKIWKIFILFYFFFLLSRFFLDKSRFSVCRYRRCKVESWIEKGVEIIM